MLQKIIATPTHDLGINAECGLELLGRTRCQIAKPLPVKLTLSEEVI
jgi:hypothetical protein